MSAVAPETAPRRSSRGALIAVVVIVAAAAMSAAWGISSREKALTDLTKETHDAAVVTVAVTHPAKGSAAEEVTLPGNIQAFTDAAIFARTSGYLKARHADIGSRVKAGQMLAEIDTPEVDQQLLQARADLASAQANAKLAKTTSDRYEDLMKSDSVSRQDLDNAQGNYEAKQAAVLSADANVKRLEAMQKFRVVYAPFDGVITARNIDIGALIPAGSGAKEMFHIAAVGRLRIFINVPQTYTSAIKIGTEAEIEIQNMPGRTFTGKTARTAQSIDPNSRTLLTEIDLDNPRGEILPGSFAQVHLKLPTDATTFRVPVNTMIFRSEGMRLAVVKNGVVSLVPVQIGRDFGTTIEIVSGLKGSESIVVNPPDSLADGQSVAVAAPEPKKPQP
ncbi:MAG TPA: efflux RND transporter periplasmic adaptor subunit [Vicinamibacterales bacterium]